MNLRKKFLRVLSGQRVRVPASGQQNLGYAHFSRRQPESGCSSAILIQRALPYVRHSVTQNVTHRSVCKLFFMDSTIATNAVRSIRWLAGTAPVWTNVGESWYGIIYILTTKRNLVNGCFQMEYG